MRLLLVVSILHRMRFRGQEGKYPLETRGMEEALGTLASKAVIILVSAKQEISRAVTSCTGPVASKMPVSLSRPKHLSSGNASSESSQVEMRK
jgi:hypothetical protein